MKASFISATRLFKKHIARLITIIAIVIVSIGFMSGVGEVEPKIESIINNYYKSQNISDLYLKSKNNMGFSADEIAEIENTFGANNIMKLFTYEFKKDGKITRVYSYDLQNDKINKVELLEGNYPAGDNEVLVERETKLFESAEVGETVIIAGNTYTVSGIVKNPLLMHYVDERSFLESGKKVSQVFYVNSSSLFMVNDIYVTFENRTLFNAFNKEYEEKVNLAKQDIVSKLGEENVSALSLFENFALYSLNSYGDKIGLIAIIFVVFFLLVTLLVVYSTMSRLLDEERSQIACQKTLGYSGAKITGKYTFFVFIATLVGGIFAFAVGLGLTRVVYFAMRVHYDLPAFGNVIDVGYYFFTFGVILVSTCLLTFITGMKIADQKPVNLLLPKSAKVGKKVLIERIPFVWDRLSFRYKSTARNVFLFKSRFLMTVVSIIGSSVLVLAGLGLYDCMSVYDGMESITIVSVIVIIFSAVLSALVIYNITNINVSERNREIATLMVLGYHENEVTGYIFREVYIMSLIGAILGIPFGIVFLEFVFGVLDIGALTDINWWTWVLAPLLTMFFSFIATMFLRRKIIKIDMNASLKSIE